MKAVKLTKPTDQSVTFVELFFDLVFVFSVTQVVTLLGHEISWQTAGQATLVFWLIWWAWTQFAWALNTANTEDSFIRLGVLFSTGIAFFMAVGVPDVFTGGALRFALPYILVKIVGNILLYFVSLEIPATRARLRKWVLFSSGGLIAVFLGAYYGGVAQYWLWGLAILLDINTANVSGRSGSFEWSFRSDHFAERHGLFVIIALGEMLILTAGGTSETFWTIEYLTVVLLVVMLSIGLWWTYFGRAQEALENALSSARGSTQSRIAVDIYSLLHFAILSGLIGFAASIESALSHPIEALPTPHIVAFSIGMILFVGAMAFALWRATGNIPYLRFTFLIVAVLAIFALAGLAVKFTLGIALTAIIAISILEK